MAPRGASAAETTLVKALARAFRCPRRWKRAVVARLDQAQRTALESPAILRRIEELGSLPARADQRGPAAVQALVRSEVDRWATVIRAAGIQPQ